MTALDNITLIGAVGDGVHTACLMSARALLDGRPFSDAHPSTVLRRIGIHINDGPWWESDAERTRVLLPLAMDERLCASKCDASVAAERRRAALCAHWALSFAAPFALDCAAAALQAKWPDRAEMLSGHADKLRREPTEKNARAAADATYPAAYFEATAATYAADAAADAADATYATYAAEAAADAATYAEAYADGGLERNALRDSLIELFGKLLDVGAGDGGAE